MNLLLAEILLQYDHKLSPDKKTIDGVRWDKIFEFSNDLHLAVDFHPNGNISILRFYKGVLLHRLRTDGPARISCNQSGNIIRQEFGENGKQIK